jgi:hypothetical protein
MPEIMYEPYADAAMSGINPDTNYGAGTSISLGVAYFGGGKSEFYRAILDFDVSDLAGESIASARLERFVYDVVGEPGAGAQIVRCTRPGAWVDSEVTWNNYKTGSAWTTPGGDLSLVAPAPVAYTEAGVTGWHAVTGLGAFVDDALANRGGIVSLVLRLADETPDASAEYVFFSTRSTLHQPRLVVEYGEAAPMPAGRRSESDVPERGGQRPAHAARPAHETRPASERRPA